MANIHMKGLAHRRITVRIASTKGFISLLTSLWRSLASLSTGVKLVPLEDGILRLKPFRRVRQPDYPDSTSPAVQCDKVKAVLLSAMVLRTFKIFARSKLEDAKISIGNPERIGSLVTAEITSFLLFPLGKI